MSPKPKEVQDCPHFTEAVIGDDDLFKVCQPVTETEPSPGPRLFRQSLLIPESYQACALDVRAHGDLAPQRMFAGPW